MYIKKKNIDFANGRGLFLLSRCMTQLRLFFLVFLRFPQPSLSFPQRQFFLSLRTFFPFVFVLINFRSIYHTVSVQTSLTIVYVIFNSIFSTAIISKRRCRRRQEKRIFRRKDASLRLKRYVSSTAVPAH